MREASPWSSTRKRGSTPAAAGFAAISRRQKPWIVEMLEDSVSRPRRFSSSRSASSPASAASRARRPQSPRILPRSWSAALSVNVKARIVAHLDSVVDDGRDEALDQDARLAGAGPGLAEDIAPRASRSPAAARVSAARSSLLLLVDLVLFLHAPLLPADRLPAAKAAGTRRPAGPAATRPVLIPVAIRVAASRRPPAPRRTPPRGGCLRLDEARSRSPVLELAAQEPPGHPLLRAAQREVDPSRRLDPPSSAQGQG